MHRRVGQAWRREGSRARGSDKAPTADTHRGQRPCRPQQQAGHMTASNPPTTTTFLLRAGGHPHMALLVDRQHHGMGRGIDIKADHVAQFGGEGRIVGELEAADPVRRQAVGAPDALHRGDADADRLGHGGGSPVRRLAGRRRGGQRHHLVDRLLAERLHPRRPRLVAQQARRRPPP